MSDAGTRVVRLLTTGGTISTTVSAHGRTSPTLGPEDLAALAGNGQLTVEARELTRRPSWQLDPAAMAAIATAAREEARALAEGGVVVTHGTTTMEYTAFLTDLVLDVDTPVVFTGSMRRADDVAPDGPRNLRAAITVAAADEARGHGALVVFADRIIAARRAWKARRFDEDAFVDLGGDLGRVTEDGFTIGRPLPRLQSFSGRLEPRVALVKAVPGMDGTLLATALDAGARGLVVEGLPGAGGIPPGMFEALSGAAAAIPVALASRAPYGALPDEPTGGTGVPLLGVPLLSAGPLTAEQAWVLLMASLGDHATPARASERFSAAIESMTQSADESTRRIR
jgi:L-asparaginase